MQLLYYRDPIGNFGDDLNLWLWPRILPRPIPLCFDDQTLFIGIGTLLSRLHIPALPPKKVVFGAGAGYGPPPVLDPGWTIRGVRGRRTAEFLGLPKSLAIGDPGLLVRNLKSPPGKTRHRVSFMPHHRTAQSGDWRAACEAASVHYLDPAEPVETILDALAASQLVITESMHGAILADTFRVPHIPIRTSSHILEFKWQDWAETVGIEHEFEDFPALHDKSGAGSGASIEEVRQRILWLVRHGRRRLSRDDRFRRTCERLDRALDELRASIISAASGIATV